MRFISLVEAIFIGLLLVPMHFGLGAMIDNRILVSFLAGFFIHIGFEMAGLNHWFCRRLNAL